MTRRKLFKSIGFTNPNVMIDNGDIHYQTMFWLQNERYGKLVTVYYSGQSKWRLTITSSTGYSRTVYNDFSYSDVMEFLEFCKVVA